MERFEPELQEFLKEHGVTQEELDRWGDEKVNEIWGSAVKRTIVQALIERKEWNDGYIEWAKKKGLPI